MAIKINQFGPELTPDNLGILTLLEPVVGNEHLALISATENRLTSKALIELAGLAERANPAQQIMIEDIATCILKKVLDYANRNVLKNSNLSLQQEPSRIVN